MVRFRPPSPFKWNASMGANTSIPVPEPLPKRTRVIVADPYPVIVHGIRKMVEDDPRFQVVAVYFTTPSFGRMSSLRNLRLLWSIGPWRRKTWRPQRP